MFEDRDAEDNPSIGFASNWKTSRSIEVSECQTEKQSSGEMGSQSKEFSEAETQTMESENQVPEISNPLEDPKFYKFIMAAVPMIERELKLAARSRAFDGYKLLENDTDLEAQKLHTLDNNNNNSSNNNKVVQVIRRVSCVTWSNAGATIAVCYEQDDHEDWCEHSSSIDIWNLRRRNFDVSVPQITLSAPTCLTVAAFHPTEPATLAAAGHSGEVFIWNVSSSSSNVIENHSSSSGNYNISGHREKVTSLVWVSSTDVLESHSGRQHLLASSGLDGRIILWSQDAKLAIFAPESKKDPSAPKETNPIKDLFPAKRMTITTDHLINKVRPKTDIAITSMTVSRHDGATVILGTESGIIFQGSLKTVHELESDKLDLVGIGLDDAKWFDPVKSIFAGHTGRVLDVKFSPFHANTFVSVGSDREIRVYSLLQGTPVKIIYAQGVTVYKLAWSPSRPLVFGATCSNSRVLVYDLRTVGNPTELKATEKQIQLPITSLEFNRSDVNLVAGGDAEGLVHIWRIPTNLSSIHSNELDIIDSFSNSIKD